MTAVAEKTDLNGRLAEAQRAAEPLRRRVSELEAELSTALSTSNYMVASQHQRDLVPAREQAAIAESLVRALSEAAGVIRQQIQDEQAAILEQQRIEQARVQFVEAQQRERDALDEIEHHLAAARAGVLAVQQSLHAALNAEQTAGHAKHAYYAAAEASGEWPGGAIVAVSLNATGAIERDPLLSSILRYRGAP